MSCDNAIRLEAIESFENHILLQSLLQLSVYHRRDRQYGQTTECCGQGYNPLYSSNISCRAIFFILPRYFLVATSLPSWISMHGWMCRIRLPQADSITNTAACFQKIPGCLEESTFWCGQRVLLKQTQLQKESCADSSAIIRQWRLRWLPVRWIPVWYLTLSHNPDPQMRLQRFGKNSGDSRISQIKNLGIRMRSVDGIKYQHEVIWRTSACSWKLTGFL